MDFLEISVKSVWSHVPLMWTACACWLKQGSGRVWGQDAPAGFCRALGKCKALVHPLAFVGLQENTETGCAH